MDKYTPTSTLKRHNEITKRTHPLSQADVSFYDRGKRQIFDFTEDLPVFILVEISYH